MVAERNKRRIDKMIVMIDFSFAFYRSICPSVYPSQTCPDISSGFFKTRFFNDQYQT
ncbi:hypothetical protein DPMN_185536 [Dreissena polymorpha]|uniref:Uncharacterized protein n=1 Tax=Dreissena polymorpha TaxID=45954 RepID=A0A9D4DMF1_DREPO|nr:hypothetical protein DPMN_185536 [Dreissena polymorpha]